MSESNKDAFIRFVINPEGKDTEGRKDSKISKGRPGLVRIDNYFADKAVTDAIEGDNHV